MDISATCKVVIDYKHHEIVHKINATSRGVWNDLSIRDMEALMVL